jgi:hypothetical protein
MQVKQHAQRDLLVGTSGFLLAFFVHFFAPPGPFLCTRGLNKSAKRTCLAGSQKQLYFYGENYFFKNLDLENLGHVSGSYLRPKASPLLPNMFIWHTATRYNVPLSRTE